MRDDFESSENFFFVHLPNLNAKKKAGDDEINDEIKEDISGLSLAGVKKIVGGLTESGLLAREGSKKAGRWVALK